VDWKKGKPVRVVRNYKLCKHSKYAPELGNRFVILILLIKCINLYCKLNYSFNHNRKIIN